MTDSIIAETHTNGPWEASSTGAVVAVPRRITRDYHDRDRLIALVYPVKPDGEYVPGTLEANAKLIAAAPDLLGVCRTLITLQMADGRLRFDSDEFFELMSMAHAAVAKAVGR